MGNPIFTLSRIFPGARVIKQGLWVGQMLTTLERVFPALLMASMPGILKKPMAHAVVPVPPALKSECLGKAY